MLIRFQVGEVRDPERTACQLADQIADVHKAIFRFGNKPFDESKHRRYPKGDKRGGQFAPKHGGTGSQPVDRKPQGRERQAAPAPAGQSRPPFGVSPETWAAVQAGMYAPKPAKPKQPRGGVLSLMDRLAGALRRKPGAGAPATTRPPQAQIPDEGIMLLNGVHFVPIPPGQVARTTVTAQPAQTAKPQTAKPQTAKPQAAKPSRATPEPQSPRAADLAYSASPDTPAPRAAAAGSPLYRSTSPQAAEARKRILDLYRQREQKIEQSHALMVNLDKQISETLRAIARQQGVPNPTLMQQLQKARDDYADAKASRDWFLSEFQAEVRKTLAVKDPIQVKSITTTLDEPRKGAVEVGLPIFEQLVSQANLTGRYDKVAFLKIHALRSHYQEGKTLPLGYHGQVKLGRGAGARAVVHGLGHWLEAQNPKIHQAAVEFLERRTQGETPVGLRQLVGRNYRRTEFAQPDKFIHPYIGKLYGRWDAGNRRAARNMTEVVAMGLEYMAFAPQELARDPEMFDFIYDVMHGKYA